MWRKVLFFNMDSDERSGARQKKYFYFTVPQAERNYADE